MTNNQLFTFQ